MKQLLYFTGLFIALATLTTGCSSDKQTLEPGDEEQLPARPIATTGKATVNAVAGTAVLNGVCNAAGETLTEAGFFYGRTAAEMMAAKPIICTPDAEGRISYTFSEIDNGDHYFRTYMLIGDKSYNGRTSWFEVKVAIEPEVTTEMADVISDKILLKGSYKLDREMTVEPGFRYATTKEGVTTTQFVPATTINDKEFSLEIPDVSGEDCFYQAVVRVVSSFYDGAVSEVVRPTNLSASSVANCYIVTKGGWYSIDTRKPDGTSISGVAADWLWSSGSGLVANVKLLNGRIIFQTSGNEGNSVIALTNAEGTIVWSWHIWMTQHPADQTVNNRTFLDRNIGATATDGALVESLGLYFQWGRKDPFIGANRIQKEDKYEDSGFLTTGDNGYTALYLSNEKLIPGFKYIGQAMDMAMTIANPATFYGLYNAGGWAADNATIKDYWGSVSGTKTNNDPCPAGYRVPTFPELLGYISDINTEATYEYVSDKSWGRKYTAFGQNFSFPGSAFRTWSAKLRYPGSITFFWSSTLSPTKEKYAQDFYNYNFKENQDAICYGMAIRCIKIQ